MNVGFNPNYNNSVNFGAFKNVAGRDKLIEFAGEAGNAACDLIVNNLKANEAFDTLCRNFDVNVAIKPLVKQNPNSILLEKALDLEISANKLGKKGLLRKFIELFRKKQPPVKVARYTACGTEIRTYNLAEYINTNYIKPENGLSLDLNKFLMKFMVK